MQQERNYSIDLLKTILAFLIVLHHSPSPFHDTMQPITTCAVPTFFMISGFLIFRKEISFKRIMKNAIRIMKIFLGALLIFYIWFWIRHEELYIPNFKDICLMVFANNEPLSGHLWYLMAYAYALIVIAIFTLKGKMQYLKYIAIIGLVLYFLFDIWHIYCNVPKYLTLVYCFRNFFFTAIPMMFIGSTVVDRNSIRTKTIAVW
ncbi:acyltransferase family protein, partial [Blautia wexlerae]